jgi:hypothetical protein
VMWTTLPGVPPVTVTLSYASTVAAPDKHPVPAEQAILPLGQS